MNLNQRALRRCEQLLSDTARYQVARLCDETGARIVDCGVHVAGGCEAGVAVAEICLSDLGRVSIVPSAIEALVGPAVSVRTDHPIAACLASQYAGWQIGGEKYFAMGSGPMRATRGREPIFDAIGHREDAESVIGVLESARLPHEDVCHHVAQECRVDAERLTLLVAPAASLAGTIQVVARSLETALHKMHEIGFDMSHIAAGYGTAPLPPVAKDEIASIGRTNDAVLYGGQVMVWLRGEDDLLAELGPRIPSSASPDHGRPFAEIFERYDRDFYKIDPMLFSPAAVTLNNLETGRVFHFGGTSPDLLLQSFGN